jgi:hypothetical protein
VKIVALTMRKNAEGIEMRATYSYEPGNEPKPSQVKRAVQDFLVEATDFASSRTTVKGGLQMENMREKRATMSFVEKS